MHKERARRSNRRALVFWSRARLGFVAGFRPQLTNENASTRARLSRPNPYLALPTRVFAHHPVGELLAPALPGCEARTLASSALQRDDDATRGHRGEFATHVVELAALGGGAPIGRADVALEGAGARDPGARRKPEAVDLKITACRDDLGGGGGNDRGGVAGLDGRSGLRGSGGDRGSRTRLGPRGHGARNGRPALDDDDHHRDDRGSGGHHREHLEEALLVEAGLLRGLRGRGNVRVVERVGGRVGLVLRRGRGAVGREARGRGRDLAVTRDRRRRRDQQGRCEVGRVDRGRVGIGGRGLGEDRVEVDAVRVRDGRGSRRRVGRCPGLDAVGGHDGQGVLASRLEPLAHRLPAAGEADLIRRAVLEHDVDVLTEQVGHDAHVDGHAGLGGVRARCVRQLFDEPPNDHVLLQGERGHGGRQGTGTGRGDEVRGRRCGVLLGGHGCSRFWAFAR